MSEKPRRDRYRFPESRDSRIAMVATLFVFLIVMAIFIVIIIRQGTYTIGSPTPVTLVGSERMLATAHTCVSQLQAGPPNLIGGYPRPSLPVMLCPGAPWAMAPGRDASPQHSAATSVGRFLACALGMTSQRGRYGTNGPAMGLGAAAHPHRPATRPLLSPAQVPVVPLDNAPQQV